jgi:hypothetical protein
MSAPTGTTASRPAGRLTASRASGLRRASFTAFVLLVAQFALGIYVNLYVTVPSADHGHGFGQAITNGPAGLTVHIVLGLLLIVAALGFLVQARPGCARSPTGTRSAPWPPRTGSCSATRPDPPTAPGRSSTPSPRPWPGPRCCSPSSSPSAPPATPAPNNGAGPGRRIW